MLSEAEVAAKRQRLSALPDEPPRAMGTATARPAAARGISAALRGGSGGLHAVPLDEEVTQSEEQPKRREWEDENHDEEGVEEYEEEDEVEKESSSTGWGLGFQLRDGDIDEYE